MRLSRWLSFFYSFLNEPEIGSLGIYTLILYNVS